MNIREFTRRIDNLEGEIEELETEIRTELYKYSELYKHFNKLTSSLDKLDLYAQSANHCVKLKQEIKIKREHVKELKFLKSVAEDKEDK